MTKKDLLNDPDFINAPDDAEIVYSPGVKWFRRPMVYSLWLKFYARDTNWLFFKREVDK